VGRGLAFNAGGSTAGALLGTREIDLQRAFGLFVARGMTVYDVGANVGFYSIIAAHLAGPAGRVVAFDPLRQNAEMIEHNARLNHFTHISVHEIALGNDDGKAEFLVSKNPSWGRLKIAGRPAGVIAEEMVPVRCIDSLARDGLSTADVMKIDVEGAEAEVLQGARQTLRSTRPILFIDLHGTNEKVATLLRELDYDARACGKGSTPIERCDWDSQVIAIPAEKKALRPKLESLASSSS
jgi:FkbM family methyltransferase